MRKIALMSIVMLAMAGMASAASVDVTNGNTGAGAGSGQLLSSNGGLYNSGFDTVSGSDGISLWLRVRDGRQGQGVRNADGQFVIDSPVSAAGLLRIDFQFSPKDTDTLSNTTVNGYNRYSLSLKVDSDPTENVSFADGQDYPVFDDDDGDGQFVKSPNGDIDDRDDNLSNGTTDSSWEPGDDQEELTLDGSWDDGDSLIIDRVGEKDGGPVVFESITRTDLPEWVVVNSWKPEWIQGGLYSSPTAPGIYDIQLQLKEYKGMSGGGHSYEYTTLRSQLQVVPEPLTMLAVGSAVAGLGGYIRRRRRG